MNFGHWPRLRRINNGLGSPLTERREKLWVLPEEIVLLKRLGHYGILYWSHLGLRSSLQCFPYHLMVIIHIALLPKSLVIQEQVG